MVGGGKKRDSRLRARILIVTQWYVPEPAHLISGLAETLAEAGCDVTVLTGFPNYPTGKLYAGYRLKLWQRETINGVSVVRVPLFPSHDRSALKRAVNYMSFAISASLLGLFLVRRPQVIHVYHPPLTAIWPAWFLSRVMRVPFTLEIQDLWPETLAATGMVRSRRVLRTVGWLAKQCYKRAAAIRVISNGFLTSLEGKGVPPTKVHVIPNWTDVSDGGSDGTEDALAVEIGSADKFTIMFAGNMGLAQGLENVLEAAVLLRDDPHVQFLLVGDGVDLERLQTLKRDRHVDNVAFLGRYPREKMSALYALTDVLLVSLADDPLFRITIPHKVYSYMASGRPVLVTAEGDAAEAVTSVAAGLSCIPGDPVALAEAVRRLQGMTQAERDTMGENGRNAVTELNSRESVVGQMAAMMESVVC